MRCVTDKMNKVEMTKQNVNAGSHDATCMAVISPDHSTRSKVEVDAGTCACSDCLSFEIEERCEADCDPSDQCRGCRLLEDEERELGFDCDYALGHSRGWFI